MCEERPNRTDRTAPNVALVESGRTLTRRSLRFAISGYRDFRQRALFGTARWMCCAARLVS